MHQISSEESYQDGDVIFEEGNAGDWIYVVISGAVEISKRIEDKHIVVEVLEPDEVFGELSFISQAARTATARAVGQTMVGIIDRDFLDLEFNKLSGDFRLILKSLAQRLKKTTETAFDAKMRRTNQRVKKVLGLTFKTGSGLVKAFTEDMSIGGMFIRTPKPLAKGELFTLKLNMPNLPEPMKIGCEVMWDRNEAAASQSQLPGMGVKFIQISESDQHRLKKEVTKNIQ
jgi:CRP/FNR family transcriptional regulator, cyclic AMP receptor protein